MNMQNFLLGFLFYLIPFIIVIFFSFCGQIFGSSKANKKLRKEIKKVKLTNPYTYFRDIPNDYGVGVYALLIDHRINEKDLKAAIIDLSAKGYLKINTNKNYFEAKIISKDISDLLNNEKFILEWINNNKEQKFKSFDIKKWEQTIIDDCINLNLAVYRDNLKLDDIELRKKRKYKLVIYPTSLVFIGCYIYMFATNTSYMGFPFKNVEGLFKSIMMFILWITINLPFSIIISIIAFIILYIIVSFILVFYYSKKDTYYFKMYDKLIYTDSTVETLQKIYSLGAFLKDFSNFVDREIEQVVIWERYFSYAYLFGLNNKLNLKYIKIYKNHFFNLEGNIEKIDSILLRME